MLTSDLVQVRRRRGELRVVGLSNADRDRLLPVAEAYVAAAKGANGWTLSRLDRALDDVGFEATDYKRVRGLRKLTLDRCTFEPAEDVDPSALRRRVFAQATSIRQSMAEDGIFEPEAVLGSCGVDPAADPFEILFGDLKENHRLRDFEGLSGGELLRRYELAQEQAVLLRALSVTVTLHCPDPGTYRRFFARLKFRRLLYRLERLDDGGYRIHIDGPHSLFSAVTKYGLQLALMLPVLKGSGRWELEARVRWDKEKDREPLRFTLAGGAEGDVGEGSARLPDEVEALVTKFQKLDSGWEIAVADELLDLPGIGQCVPDLIFTHRATQTRVFLEVMGYWSREAVWRRIELVQGGLSERILFAVSSRLRVSEAALDDDLPGQLYVYKGSMSAKIVAQRLDALLD